MFRKSVNVVLVLCLMLAVFGSGAALAQKPEPPQSGWRLPDAPPEINLEDLPEAAQKAIALRDSFTPEQQVALRAILDKYLPDIQAAEDGMAALGKPGAEPQPVDRAAAAKLDAVFSSIEAELAGILDAEQLAAYQAVAHPRILDAAALPKPAGPQLVRPNVTTPQSYVSQCYSGAYNNAGSTKYSYYAYMYGLYSYYYYGCAYGYYAYVYFYYAYLYASYAVTYSAADYFTLYYFSGYVSSYPYYAYVYSYYAYVYADYGYTYAYYADYYCGDDYAYRAKYYGYTAYAEAYNATDYNYTCYYYNPN